MGPRGTQKDAASSKLQSMRLYCLLCCKGLAWTPKDVGCFSIYAGPFTPLQQTVMVTHGAQQNAACKL